MKKIFLLALFAFTVNTAISDTAMQNEIAQYLPEMIRLYQQDVEEQDAKLVKYALIDIDNDGISEVLLVNDKYGQREEYLSAAGAVFSVVGGKPTLLFANNSRFDPQFYPPNVFRNGGSCGGPTICQTIVILQDSLPLHKFSSMDVYGEFDDGHLDGKEINKAEADKFLAKYVNPYLPQAEYQEPKLNWIAIPKNLR